MSALAANVSRVASDTSTSPNLLSDDPRDGSPERPDELGRDGFAIYLNELLDNVRAQSESSVMALIGAWGSGKSSVLELLQRDLVGTDWSVATFNPWSYPDTASLQQGFFAELTAALPSDDRPTSPKRRIGEFARTISPLGKIGGLVGIDAEGVVDAVAGLLIGDTSATAAKRAAEATLRKAKKPVLMVIDDLDRLTPAELLEVLKLVRLVGRLPYVYYLLGYDERTLLDVLRHTPIAADDETRARAYLEKIVQVRLDMPALRETQRTDLLNLGLAAILENSSIRLTSDDEQRLGDLYFSVLDRRLTTPRAISRFLGQVQAFYPPVRSEVDFVDFFLVSWLRTQEPGIYEMIQHEKKALLGNQHITTSWLSSGRDQRAAQERLDFWRRKIDGAAVAPHHRDGVERVLSSLFPEVQAALASGDRYTSASERRTPRAISNADYYDRYVSFGVPDDDVRDSVVRDALSHLSAGTHGPALERLTAELRANVTRTARKIDTLREAEDLPERAIFSLLAENWTLLDDTLTDFFDRPRRAAERAAATCLFTLDPGDAIAAAEAVALEPNLEPFVANVVQAMQRALRARGAGAPPDYDLDGLRAIASGALSRNRERSRTDSPFAPDAMTHFYTWAALDPDAAHAWLRCRVDDGPWTLLETVGALTSVATRMGLRDSHPTIGQLDLSTIETAFTLDRVFTELGLELDAAGVAADADVEIEATSANRIAFALQHLERERRRAITPES